MSALGIGIIGCGNISTTYFKLAPLFRGLEVRACSDMNMDVATAKQHARSTGLSLIAAMKHELGDLDRVKRIVKVLGMVNAIPEFTQQPEVINGCSDLFVEVFGDRGKHARSAVGMGSLPRGIPVEIECIVEVE